MTGDTLTLSGSLQQLSALPDAFRQLTLRLNTSATTIQVNLENGTKVGFLKADETWTFGPFGPSNSVKISDIYVTGTAAEELYWYGVEA